MKLIEITRAFVIAFFLTLMAWIAQLLMPSAGWTAWLLPVACAVVCSVLLGNVTWAVTGLFQILWIGAGLLLGIFHSADFLIYAVLVVLLGAVLGRWKLKFAKR